MARRSEAYDDVQSYHAREAWDERIKTVAESSEVLSHAANPHLLESREAPESGKGAGLRGDAPHEVAPKRDVDVERETSAPTVEKRRRKPAEPAGGLVEDKKPGAGEEVTTTNAPPRVLVLSYATGK